MLGLLLLNPITTVVSSHRGNMSRGHIGGTRLSCHPVFCHEVATAPSPNLVTAWQIVMTAESHLHLLLTRGDAYRQEPCRILSNVAWLGGRKGRAFPGGMIEHQMGKVGARLLVHASAG